MKGAASGPVCIKMHIPGPVGADEAVIKSPEYNLFFNIRNFRQIEQRPVFSDPVFFRPDGSLRRLPK